MPEKEPTGTGKGAPDAWVEAQRAMIEGWLNLTTSALQLWKPSDPDANIQQKHMVEQWNQFWDRSLDLMTAGTSPLLKATFDQFSAIQKNSLRFAEFSAKAMGALLKPGETEGDLQAAIEKTREDALREWVYQPEDLLRSTEDINQLWRYYLEWWQRFGSPWGIVLERMPEITASSISGDSRSLRDLADVYRQAYQQTFGKFVTSPSLGLTRGLNEKLLSAFDDWIDWQLSVQEYQSVMADTWRVAIEDYFDRLLKLAERGEKLESVRDLVLFWTRGAEEIFSEKFQSDEYVLVQGKMLEAAMSLRIQQRKIMQDILSIYDLPTRDEVDDAHRRIYELRKEVKALKVQLAELQDKPQSGLTNENKTKPGPPPAKKPRSRKPRQTKPKGEGG
jgi:class III poly(R)-hydroxyalkanoic acid synthase PhaE subunit